MREFAEGFYKSQAWKKCRAEYAKKQRHLCETCLQHGLYRPGEIVHHVQPITVDNIECPEITLAFDNLRLLCRECHAAEHDQRKKDRRYIVEADGRIVAKCDT